MNRRVALRSLALGVPVWALPQWTWADGAEGKEAKKEDQGKANKEEKPPKPAVEEEEVPLKDVPDKVRKAAGAAAPNAKWESACRIKEDGKVTWELEGVNRKGREVVVTLTPDGEVVEIEVEIRPRDVPDVVRDAVKAKWPGFKIASAFEVRKEGKVVSYDLEGKRPEDKHEVGVSASADGTELEIDEEE